jgi:hypothetical protein
LIVSNHGTTDYKYTERNYDRGGRMAAISQGGLDLWLEQASDFFAGRQRCI